GAVAPRDRLAAPRGSSRPSDQWQAPPVGSVCPRDVCSDSDARAIRDTRPAYKPARCRHGKMECAPSPIALGRSAKFTFDLSTIRGSVFPRWFLGFVFLFPPPAITLVALLFGWFWGRTVNGGQPLSVFQKTLLRYFVAFTFGMSSIVLVSSVMGLNANLW